MMYGICYMLQLYAGSCHCSVNHHRICLCQNQIAWDNCDATTPQVTHIILLDQHCTIMLFHSSIHLHLLPLLSEQVSQDRVKLFSNIARIFQSWSEFERGGFLCHSTYHIPNTFQGINEIKFYLIKKSSFLYLVIFLTFLSAEAATGTFTVV